MKWKEGVKVTKKKKDSYLLRMNQKEKKILPEHNYLLEAIQNGIEDDKELVDYIIEQEEICEAAAGFTLAGFIIEYADFIAEDKSHYEII